MRWGAAGHGRSAGDSSGTRVAMARERHAMGLAGTGFVATSATGGRGGPRDRHDPEAPKASLSEWTSHPGGLVRREPVTSTNIRSVGYDPETSTLEVEFVNAHVYEYRHGGGRVPAPVGVGPDPEPPPRPGRMAPRRRARVVPTADRGGPRTQRVRHGHGPTRERPGRDPEAGDGPSS